MNNKTLVLGIITLLIILAMPAASFLQINSESKDFNDSPLFNIYLSEGNKDENNKECNYLEGNYSIPAPLQKFLNETKLNIGDATPGDTCWNCPTN